MARVLSNLAFRVTANTEKFRLIQVDFSVFLAQFLFPICHMESPTPFSGCLLYCPYLCGRTLMTHIIHIHRFTSPAWFRCPQLWRHHETIDEREQIRARQHVHYLQGNSPPIVRKPAVVPIYMAVPRLAFAQQHFYAYTMTFFIMMLID